MSAAIDQSTDDPLELAIDRIERSAGRPPRQSPVQRFRSALGSRANRRQALGVVLVALALLAARTSIPLIAAWMAEPVGSPVIAPGRVEPVRLLVGGKRWLPRSGRISQVSARIARLSRYRDWRDGDAHWIEPQESVDVGILAGPEASASVSKQALFDQSRRVAPLAAAALAKKDVSDMSGSGVIVISAPPPWLSNDSNIEPGSVIVKSDGIAIGTTYDLQRVVKRATGDYVTVGFAGGDSATIRIPDPKVKLERDLGLLGMATMTRDLDARTDPPIEIINHTSTGASAGLAYAIASYIALTGDDVLRGRSVAATGVIQEDGSVIAVRYALQKGRATATSGVDMFLVPFKNVDEARRFSDGIDVVGVNSLKDAIAALNDRR